MTKWDKTVKEQIVLGSSPWDEENDKLDIFLVYPDKP